MISMVMFVLFIQEQITPDFGSSIGPGIKTTQPNLEFLASFSFQQNFPSIHTNGLGP
jgi:hypothetical protein